MHPKGLDARCGADDTIDRQRRSPAWAAATVERMNAATSGLVLSVVTPAKALTARSTTALGTVCCWRSTEVIWKNCSFWGSSATEAVAVHQYSGPCPVWIQGSEYAAHHSAPGITEQDAVFNLQLIQDLA